MILIISLVFIQCKKEDEVSKTVFWIPSHQAEILKASGVDYVKVYLDTTHIGNVSMDSEFLSAPSCHDGNTLTFESPVDYKDSYEYYLTLMSQDTSFIVEEQISFNKPGCHSFNIAGTQE